MRIFLLPLTTRQALVYCQRISQKPTSQRTIFDRISQKTTETWAKWEQAEKGWQKKVVYYGNRALQRIPYQEWALKSFPPTNANLQAEQVTNDATYDVVFPGNVMKKEDVSKVLSRLARERKQLHYNRFIGSMIGMPFTIPFALIPVIPNLPFFYVAYRCWSHWRALKGSDHLDFLLDHRLFRPVSTPEIEGIYDRIAPGMDGSFDFVTRSQIEDGSAKKEQLLLPPGAHTDVSKSLEVPELSNEVERAIWQVEQASIKAATEEQEKQTQQQSQQASVDEKHEERK